MLALVQVLQQQGRSGTSCIAGKSDKCRKNYPKQKQKKSVKRLYDKGFIVGAVLEEIAELAVPEAKISKLKYLTKGTKISSIVEIEKGFDNFYRLKRQLGDPWKGLQWHHIVEQSQIKSYRAGFAPKQIHSIGNIVALPSGAGSIHAKISSMYSSVHPYKEKSSGIGCNQEF